MSDTTSHGIRFGRIAPTLSTRDLDRALAFYVGVLGFRIAFSNGDPIGFVILRNGDAELHLTLQPRHRASHANVAHLMVDDVDALHALCKGHGLRIVRGVQDKDYGLRAFVFEDPDGNRVDVGQRIAL